jgi:hypothetical protein
MMLDPAPRVSSVHSHLKYIQGCSIEPGNLRLAVPEPESVWIVSKCTPLSEPDKTTVQLVTEPCGSTSIENFDLGPGQTSVSPTPVEVKVSLCVCPLYVFTFAILTLVKISKQSSKLLYSIFRLNNSFA